MSSKYFTSSDITVKFAGQKLSAHKFIMAARSDFWSNRDLNELTELELTGLNVHPICDLLRPEHVFRISYLTSHSVPRY